MHRVLGPLVDPAAEVEPPSQDLPSCKLPGPADAGVREACGDLVSFYRYDQDSDVHLVDCGGEVTLETGMARLRVLSRELAARPARDGIAKLLIDFRLTVWEDENVHMELSRITRTEFGLNPGNSSIRAAVVNTRWKGPVADNEHWFLSDIAAMYWLCSGKAQGRRFTPP